MRLAAVIIALVVLLALAAGMWFGAGGGFKDIKDDIAVEVAVAQTGKAPPARELAPRSLFYYVEARDLAAHWDQVTTSEAWTDLEASNVLDVIADNERVKAFLDGLNELAAKAEMPVTRDNLMNFLGRECAVGLALNAQAGDPDILLVTRLDVEALTREMLKAEGDWEALQGELNRRQGKLEFTVTTEPYGDYKLATAVKDDLTIVSTQIEDTLVLGTRRDLVTACLDARAGGGVGSLSKLPEFTKEMDALPNQALGRAWINFQGLDVQRQLLVDSLHGADVPEHGVQGVLRVLDSTKGRGGLAMVVDLPHGDLYRLRFDQLSKSGEQLFTDPARPDLRAIVSQDAMLYAELRDLKGVLRAWSGSEVKRRLLDSHMWRRMEESAGEGLGTVVGRMPPAPAGEQQPEKPKIEGPFLPRFLGRVFLGQVDALLAGRGAVSVTWDAETEEHPRVDAAVQLDVAGRLAYLFAEGSTKHRILNNEIRDVGMTDHRGRTILVSMEGTEPLFAVALAGDTLFGSTSAARLKVLLDGADYGAVEGARPAVELAERGGFGDDFRAYMYVDGDRWRQELVRWGDKMADPAAGQGPDFANMIELLDGSLSFANYGVAFYVDDAFTRCEFRHAVTTSDRTSASAKRLLDDPGSGELRSWKHTPEDTFLWTGNRLDLEAYWGLIRESIPTSAQGDVDAGLQELEEPLEMSLEKDVLPAIGPEVAVGFSIGRAPPTPPNLPAGADPPVAIPGVFVSVEVRDEAPVRKLVDRLFEMGNEASRERFSQAPEDPPAPDLFVKASHQGVEYVTLALTERDKREIPIDIQPALGFQDGFLTLTLHVRTFHSVVDVGKGRGKNLRNSELVGRMVREGADFSGRTVNLVDWNGLVDQIGEYRAHLGELVPEAEMPDFPQYPENGDDKEWARRVKEWETGRAEGAQRGAAAIGRYLDSLRLIDYAVGTSRAGNGMETGSYVIRFTE